MPVARNHSPSDRSEKSPKDSAVRADDFEPRAGKATWATLAWVSALIIVLALTAPSELGFVLSAIGLAGLLVAGLAAADGTRRPWKRARARTSRQPWESLTKPR